MSAVATQAGAATAAQETAIVAETVQPPSRTAKMLADIPAVIDALPTWLPPQSDQAIVPDTEQTLDDSWADRKQSQMADRLDRYAARIDRWFGVPDPAKPASAQIRIYLDNQWNAHDGYAIRPRIQGRLKLPTLQKRVSLVFGDDTLDNEIRNGSVVTQSSRIIPENGQALSTRQVRDDNSSLALRWDRLRNPWGFRTSADLGIRANQDVYARLKAQKDWTLPNDFYAHVEQIYRYGIKSEHYLRTNAELRHARPNQAYLSDQLSLTYTHDSQAHDLVWDNRLYREHQFFKDNWFNYGLYMAGHLDGTAAALNSVGPFVGWRQPLWREWFFVQAELNYLNDRDRQRDHAIGSLLRLETWF